MFRKIQVSVFIEMLLLYFRYYHNNNNLFTYTAPFKGTLSRRFCYIFVKMAQIFDKEPFFYHEIAVRAPGRKYQGIYLGKNKL